MSDLASLLAQMTGRTEPTADPALAAVRLARASIDALILKLGQNIDAKVTGQLTAGLTQLSAGGENFVLKLETPLPIGTAVTIRATPTPSGQPAVTVMPQPSAPATAAPLPLQSAPASIPMLPQPSPAPVQPQAQLVQPPAALPPTPPVPGAATSALIVRPEAAPSPVPLATILPVPAQQKAQAATVTSPPPASPPGGVPAARAASSPPPSPAPTNAVAQPTPIPPLPNTPTALGQGTAPAPTVAPTSAPVAAAPAQPAPLVALAPTIPGAQNPQPAVSTSVGSSPPVANPPATAPTPPATAVAQPPTPAPGYPVSASASLAAPSPNAAAQPTMTAPAARPAPVTTRPAQLPLQQVLADPVQAVARQASVAPLIAQAAAILRQPAAAALPGPVLEALMRVIAGRVDLNRAPPDGKALRDAVLRAGTLEAGVRQPGDARTTLLALRSALQSFLGGGKVDAVAPVARRPPPPMPGEPARAPQPVPAAPLDEQSPEETARQLLGHADGALARTKLLQLASSPPDARQPAQAAAPELRFEIPMLLGTETGMLQLVVERDGRNKQGPRQRGWRMHFAMSFSAMGEVGADVALLGRAANVSIWAAEPATADALEAMLPELKPALAGHGLDVAGLRVRRGVPPRRPHVPGQLLDSAR